MKYLDGEVVTYTCKNSEYRFPQHDGTPKEEWKESIDVVCGWNNKWEPSEITGCVDPRGCKEPPGKTDLIWMAPYKDDYGPLEVGKTYWYECRYGIFELNNGKLVPYINLTCINDPNATPLRSEPPYWEAQLQGYTTFDHLYNRFPKCVTPGKY